MRFLLLVLAVLIVPAGVRAEGSPFQHALAMHGSPKYGPDFAHLDYANPDAPKGGSIRHGVPGTFDTLNNFIIKGEAAQGLELTSDQLMARVWDEPFTLYGLVAESVQIPEDRSWIVYRIRPEARFHDGTPMTADDVVFSFEMFRDHGHPVRRRVYGLVKKVTKLDNYTVRFDFDEGYDAETALILSLLHVLPKHYWKDRDFAATTMTPPLGSGPYKIKEVKPGRQIVYERVQDYWGKDLPVNAGHYNFDTITYDYYRDDGVALEAFKAGDYDFRREWDPTRWVTAYNANGARTDRAVIREEITHGRPEWTRMLIFNTRHFPFNDRRVRKALTYAFDFEWMNKHLFHGLYKRINSTFPNSELAARNTPSGAELDVLNPFRNDLPQDVFGAAFESPATPGTGPAGLRQNLKTAADLLKESGWIVNENGKLAHSDAPDKPFTFEILLGDPKDEKIALQFSRALERLGITATVRTVDSAQFTQRLDRFDYDMVMYRWINSLSPGNEQMNYWGAAAAEQEGSRNYAGVNSPAVDVIADSIARAPDRETLVARARALDRVLMWGYYGIPLYYLGRDLVAYWDHLAHPAKTPVYGIVLETWWDRRAQ